MELVILFLAGTLVLIWIFGAPLLQRRRRQRQRETPFPPSWRRILQRRLPVYRRLPSDLQRQLQKHIQIFIAEKGFVGCRGFQVSEDVRVLIAAQACLLILNRPTSHFAALTEILVYPNEFMVDRDEHDEHGVVHRERHVLSGESWADSQVVLSWADVIASAQADDDGYNVVIHEFAHQLDQETGYANGAPRLVGDQALRSWAAVLSSEYERLRVQVEQGEPTLLDEYGAQDPVEFFAVASETFFEKPARLNDEHPALYHELSRFYCVNPLSW